MGERIKLADAKRGIGNAFDGWTEYSQTDHAYESVGTDRMAKYQQEIKDSRAQAESFLDQVEADQKQLQDALAVCETLVNCGEAENLLEYAAAVAMARDVVER